MCVCVCTCVYVYNYCVHGVYAYMYDNIISVYKRIQVNIIMCMKFCVGRNGDNKMGHK